LRWEKDGGEKSVLAHSLMKENIKKKLFRYSDKQARERLSGVVGERKGEKSIRPTGSNRSQFVGTREGKLVLL